MIRSFKLHFFLSIIASISLLLFIVTGLTWLGVCTFILCGFLIILGLTTIPSGFSEIKEVGEEQLVLKKKFGREYVILYDQIRCCVVYPTYRGASLDIKVKKANNQIITLRFGFWLASDIFNSKINKLSEKCDVYVERWPRFWKKERWKQIKVSSTWVPFDERDKKNTNA